jgi:hypothetical protein
MGTVMVKDWLLKPYCCSVAGDEFVAYNRLWNIGVFLHIAFPVGFSVFILLRDSPLSPYTFFFCTLGWAIVGTFNFLQLHFIQTLYGSEKVLLIEEFLEEKWKKEKKEDLCYEKESNS